MLYAVFLIADGRSGSDILHLAYWAPSIGMLAVISGQMDMLSSIREGKEINLKARALDFIHWFFLMFLNIGAWLVDGTAISWAILKVIMLGIIGWQIGVGIQRRWSPTKNEIMAGTIALIVAMCLGSLAGYIRYLDSGDFGWGWAVESITAIGSTLIVGWWIGLDLKNIAQKAAEYPRSMFLKGIFSNALIVWFWIHIMSLEGGLASGATHQLGLTFNTIVGNLLYFVYYGAYEVYRRRQRVVACTELPKAIVIKCD